MENSEMVKLVNDLIDNWWRYIYAVSKYNDNKDSTKEPSLAGDIRNEYKILSVFIANINTKYSQAADENEKKLLGIARYLEMSLSFSEKYGSKGDKIR